MALARSRKRDGGLSSLKDQEIYFPTASDCEEVDNSLSTISVDVGKGIVGPL